MAQAKTTKLYRTFVRGLITEASPLTYPEDSSFDELNTVPSRKGNRQRRFGINYSTDNFVSQPPYTTSDAKNEFMWEAVDAEPEQTFLVVQEGSTVSFFDRGIAKFADSKKTFTINLGLYTRPNSLNPSSKFCQFASGKGYLFIVSEEIEPLVVAYDRGTDTFTVTRIAILARDFEGLSDGLANDAEPATLSTAHFYNLMNQGWVSPKPN